MSFRVRFDKVAWIFGAVAFLVGVPCGTGDSSESAFKLAQSFDAPFALSGHEFVDVDGDSRCELVVFCVDGRVRTYGAAGGTKLVELAGQDLVLPHPKRSLLAIGRLVERDKVSHLVVAGPDGVWIYPFAPSGAVGSNGVCVSRRARFPFRTGEPTLAAILQDINEDGRLDLVLPTRSSCDLWLSREGKLDGSIEKEGLGSAQRRNSDRMVFERVAQVTVSVGSTRSTDLASLNQVLRGGIRVPNLTTGDVNGDGRQDLLVENGDHRGFHLQRADGSIPREPDVEVDLSIFTDTSPKSGIGLGEVASFGDNRQYQSRDLNGDSVPDYVIAHRRKIWVFHGSKKGPQFTKPSYVLKAAEDFSALFLMDLDEDTRPDLLLIKFRVPSLAMLVLGMLGRWSIEITPIGYANVDGISFEKTPSWRRTISIELPAILEIMKRPQALFEKFESLQGRFREEISEDFDGDGRIDVALLSAAGERIEIWRGRPEDASRKERSGDGVGRILFEEKRSDWTLEDLLNWMGGLADERILSITRGRAPDGEFVLPPPGDFDLHGIECGDVDGDGVPEMLLEYRRRGRKSQRRFELLSWGR